MTYNVVDIDGGESIARSKIAYSSEVDKASFGVYGNVAIGAGSTHIGIIENPAASGKTIYLDFTAISHNGADTVVAESTFYLDSIHTAAGTVRTPFNLNRGSAVASIASVVAGGTITNGNLFNVYFFKNVNPLTIKWDGSIVLEEGDSFHIKSKGTSGSTMYFSFHWWEL